MSSLIWLYGADNRAQEAWRQAMASECRVVTLGGEDSDLDLGPQPDLAVALAACPPPLRPKAFILANGSAPSGLQGLPCASFAAGGRALGCDAALPGGVDRAGQVLDAAKQGREWSWLPAVQVNLPLTYLLGDFRPLVQGLAINLEIGIDWQALDTLGPDDLAQAKNLLQGRRLSAHMPFMDLAPGSPDPAMAAAAMARLNAAADWAVELGAAQAVAHLGYSEDTHRDLAAFCSRFGQVMAPLATRLAKGNCRLVLENTFEPGPQVLLSCRQAMLDNGAEEVGFCLDVGHAYCFSRTGLDQWWQALAPHLGELHLHDNPGDFDSHQPPGSGVVDWALLAREIPKLNPPPLLTLEPHTEADLWATLRALERVWGRPPLDG